MHLLEAESIPWMKTTEEIQTSSLKFKFMGSLSKSLLYFTLVDFTFQEGQVELIPKWLFFSYESFVGWQNIFELLIYIYKKVDKAFYEKIYLIWINQYYLIGHSELICNPRKISEALNIFLVFKFLANTKLNEVPCNLSLIFTNKQRPIFPNSSGNLKWQIRNGKVFRIIIWMVSVI